MLRSSNPALKGDIFQNTMSSSSTDVMTTSGTYNKLAILFILLVGTFYYTWTEMIAAISAQQAPPMHWLYIGGIGGFILAIVTIFKKDWASITAPLYALCEGLLLGAISALAELRFPGIASQAAMATFGVFMVMLILYRSKIIKVTQRFMIGITAATGGIFFVYLASMILGFFGINMPFIHGSGPIGIGFSVLVVGIAAFNLILDFHRIEEGEKSRAPKMMEWYCAFGLLVTLVWLYLEMIRLLSKLRSRD